MKSIERDAAPAFVCALLQRRRGLSRDELSARTVAKALGQTTGFLYHHWGSFDHFLFEVSGLGWRRLVDSVVAAYEETKDPRSIPRAYVAFAVANPVLYWLLAERPLPSAVVRATIERGGALPSHAAWQKFMEVLARAEPGVTVARARGMHAAAHGLASQILSGRLGSSPDARGGGEGEIARAIEDAIASAFFTSRSTAPRSRVRDPRAARPARRRKTSPPAKPSRKASR